MPKRKQPKPDTDEPMHPKTDQFPALLRFIYLLARINYVVALITLLCSTGSVREAVITLEIYAIIAICTPMITREQVLFSLAVAAVYRMATSATAALVVYSAATVLALRASSTKASIGRTQRVPKVESGNIVNAVASPESSTVNLTTTAGGDAAASTAEGAFAYPATATQTSNNGAKSDAASVFNTPSWKDNLKALELLPPNDLRVDCAASAAEGLSALADGIALDASSSVVKRVMGPAAIIKPASLKHDESVAKKATAAGEDAAAVGMDAPPEKWPGSQQKLSVTQSCHRCNFHVPSHRISLETLPVDISRQITLHLDLIALETLLRASTAIARLFRCTDLSFALLHLRRLLPPPLEHECTIHFRYCDVDPQRPALTGPDYSFLPTPYAVAVFVCLGFKQSTFPIVFGDTERSYLLRLVGPLCDPRWVEAVLLASVRHQLIDDRGTTTVTMLLDFAARLDSVALAAAVLEWLSTPPPASPETAYPEFDAAAMRLLVAQCAAAAAREDALGVLAFALDHPSRIDAWDLPTPPRFQGSFLDATLLLHAGVIAANLLLGLPLPISPLERAGGDYVGCGLAPEGSTPLNLAAGAADHVFVSKLLRINGVDPKNSPYVLAAAVAHGSMEMLTELLEFGAKPDTTGPSNPASHPAKSALSAAVARGSLAALELLLKHGGDPSVYDDRSPPLHVAAAAKDPAT
ncbi:hypothetical protein HDU96_002496 [Phlyctochytrium bullatum]|nr:hypothetical protein HDU96_002496 [Phlyctochytrium bullatum]